MITDVEIESEETSGPFSYLACKNIPQLDK